MQPNQHNPSRYDAAPGVRQNAASAAFAAVCLLYFGFWRLSEPSGTELFDRCNWVLYHTIRYGGIAMAVIAVWSLIGHRPALIVDAVVSAVIGGVFVLAAGGMLIDGGGAFQSLLFVVFGAMFVSAGVRNWRDYHELTATGAGGEGGKPAACYPGFEQPYREARVEPPGSSLAGQLLERADKTTDTHASEEPPAPAGAADRNTHPGARRDSRTSDTPEAPAEGFLAALAKKDPPDKS